MNNFYKYTLSAGIALAITGVSAAADSHYADQAVENNEEFKAVYLPSAVITNEVTENNSLDGALNELGLNADDINFANQTNIVNDDELNQVYANIPDWARETIYNGGQIGYMELELNSAKTEKIYYLISGEIKAGVESNEGKSTQDILKQYGINSEDLPPIGAERWALEEGETLTLNYWVDSETTIKTNEGSTNYASLVDLAINKWNSQLAAVDAPIKFVKVSDKEQAVYTFEVGSNSSAVAGQLLRGLSGRTIMYVDDDFGTYAEDYGVETYINQDATVKSYNKEQTVNVIAHEIGHSIGLEHTEDSRDLMYSAPHNQTLRKIDAVAALIMYTTENTPGRNTKQIFG